MSTSTVIETDAATTDPRRLEPSQLRMRVTDAVAAQLREDIRTGLIPPGSRLLQVAVAARFNVSTTPVREAFAALQREGLLVGSAHRGVTVFVPTIEDFTETYEIRIPLEALATARGVENMTDDDIAALTRLVEQMKGSLDNPAHYRALNAQFHATIYRASRRPKLTKLINDLRDDSEAYLNFYGSPRPHARYSLDDHERILEACRTRMPARAAEAMTRHLERTVEFVSATLQEPTQEASGSEVGTNAGGTFTG